MLLRICLILAILGGGAVVAVNFVMVKKSIETTITARDSEKTQKEAARKQLATAQKDLTTAKANLDTTTTKLATANKDLTAAKSTADSLAKDKTDLTDRLGKTQTQRDALQASLAKFDQLKVTPDDVVKLQADVKKAADEYAGASNESDVLKKEIDVLLKRLAPLTRQTNNDVVEPAGLKGKVVAVDPKYDFVVLNIGEDHGVLPNGIMMVARDGRLIGKVQIVSVANTQSIANIMPAWRRGDVIEGDEVLY